MSSQGKSSFFIRIEDIEADFYKAFEIGEETQFQAWLQSTEEAWFFLDSVDEARLENPRVFEKALRRFATAIKGYEHRAHIFLSSRPYAWRPKEDRRLLDEILFLAAPQKDKGDATDQQSDPRSSLTIYIMRPLDKERIRCFCIARAAIDVDLLVQEIERANLWSLAERPFDLEGILAKWAKDRALGGRLELLRHNIEKRLHDDHNINRIHRQPLNIEQAKEGARRLAAAVMLCGQPGINVPDTAAAKPGIDAESVLADWDPRDVRALLERGIFNDVIYGAVRFRHRDVRELLAAEWFDKLLKTGNNRYEVEALFFREIYGEQIITPRLRPVLPWLILFDEEICRRSLRFHPEIAIEGGDPSRLPLPERRKILADIIHRIVSDEDDGSAQDNNAIARIANSELSADTLQLICAYSNNDDAIFFLGRLVWQGEMASCVAPLVDIAVDSSRGIYARIASARAAMTCGSVDQKLCLWQKLNECGSQIPRELLAEVIDGADPDIHSIKHLLTSLDKLQSYERFKGSGLGHSLHEFVERLPIIGDQEAITQFIEGLNGYLEKPPYIERGECHISEKYAWLLSPATHAVERLVKARSPVALEMAALSIMLMVPALRFWRDNDFSEYKGDLLKLVPLWPELNDTLYWTSIEQARINKLAKSSEPLTDDWSVSWLSHFWNFNTTSLPRLFEYMRFRTLQDDKLVALSTAFRVYVQTDRPINILSSLQNAVADNPALQHKLNVLLNPPVSEATLTYEKEHAEHMRRHEEKTSTEINRIVTLGSSPTRQSKSGQ